MINRLLSLLLTLTMLLNVLSMTVYAASYDSDWRLVAQTPKISFRDNEGQLISGLTDLWINEKNLSYDSSTVSYGDIQKQDYGSVDLSVTCVDYNYMIYGEGLNLPDEDGILAELTCGNKRLEADKIECSATNKAYLQVNLLFEGVSLFDDEQKEAELYIQYRRKSMEGDETADLSKGCLNWNFNNLILPNTPTEEPKDETIKVEVMLPETEQKVDAKTPYVLIQECSIEDGWASVEADSRFDMQLLMKNIHSDLPVDNLLMQVDTPNDLRLLSPSDTFYIGEVAQGATFSQLLSFETMADERSKNYVITVKFSYEYVDNGDRKSESISQKIIVPLRQEEVHEEAEEDEPYIDREKPYILIENCTIGDNWSVVTAGGQFDVEITAKNLHRSLHLDNVLMQVDTPSGLRLNSPSNVFYIGSVEDEESFAQTLRFQTMLNAEPMDYPVSIKFSYEYVDGDSRKSESITQEITIPLRQSSRFTVDELSLREEYVVGEQHSILSTYANMGRGKLYNVTAKLQTELPCDLKIVHLGNLNAGEGGAVEFEIFHEKVGAYPLEILYSYETELGQVMEERVSGEMTFVLPEDEIEEEPVIQYITEFPSEAQSRGKVPVDTFLLVVLSGLGLASVGIMLKNRK